MTFDEATPRRRDEMAEDLSTQNKQNKHSCAIVSEKDVQEECQTSEPEDGPAVCSPVASDRHPEAARSRSYPSTPRGGAFWQISNKGNSGPARRIAVTETVSKEARPESKEVSARTRARTAAPRATWDDGTLGHRFEWAPQFRSARA